VLIRFFKIDLLKSALSFYGLYFEKCKGILPGLKCARLYGSSSASPKPKGKQKLSQSGI
jgi:hypothetical protein